MKSPRPCSSLATHRTVLAGTAGAATVTAIAGMVEGAHVASFT